MIIRSHNFTRKGLTAAKTWQTQHNISSEMSRRFRESCVTRYTKAVIAASVVAVIV